MPTVIQFQAPVRCISEGNLLAEGPGGHPDGAATPLGCSGLKTRGCERSFPGIRAPTCSSSARTSPSRRPSRKWPGCARGRPSSAGFQAPCFSPKRDGLLIGDVSTLMLEQQLDFYDWLDRFGESAQVVSVTSVPLWPIVERGRFLEGLFYRLNVVSLTAGPGNR